MRFDEELHRLCQTHDVAAVYLFGTPGRGSAAGPGDPMVGVLFGGPRTPEETTAVQPALLRDFQALLGAERLDLADLQQAGPLVQFQGIRGRLVYSADEGRRADFEERAVRDYLDFAFEMRLFNEERAEEIHRGDGGG